VRHCHILDPRTGLSARGFQSVTVHAPTCLVAGTATTIAMLKGREAGLAWLDGLRLPYFAVMDDGAIVNRFEGTAP
jgi:thiamine biosynthesis lipoprotein